MLPSLMIWLNAHSSIMYFMSEGNDIGLRGLMYRDTDASVQ